MLLFTVSGAVIGEQVGSRAQGRLFSFTAERLMGVIFAAIDINFPYMSGTGLLG